MPKNNPFFGAFILNFKSVLKKNMKELINNKLDLS